MANAIKIRLVITWFLLTAITLLAWWIGSSNNSGTLHAEATVGVSAMAITLIKVRVIIREFMDVRCAPKRLGLIIDSWLTVFVIAMSVAYFVAG